MNSAIVRTYKAQHGAQFSDEDAQATGEYLEQTLGPDAGCSAELFVELAKPKRSPIHHLIQWDDAIAAQEYRLGQARHVLNHIAVVISNGKERETRAFQNVVVITDQGAERTYMPAHMVWKTPELSSQVIDQARRYLRIFTERFREYEQLAGAIGYVEKALQEMEADGS